MKFEHYEVINPQIVPANRKLELDRRYLAFAHAKYYPSGGLQDLIATADTFEEVMVAVEEARKYHYGCIWHVYDSATGEIVSKGHDDGF